MVVISAGWPGGAGLPLKGLLLWAVRVLPDVADVLRVQVQLVDVVPAPGAVVSLGHPSFNVAIRSGAAGGPVVVWAGSVCPV